MSRRREIGGRLAALTDIAGILSAMKSLALMETRLLSDFLDQQQRLAAGIEAAAADFLAWRGEFAPLPGEERELCVLVGSEQGFCGDFNEAIAAWVRATCATNPAPACWVVVGAMIGLAALPAVFTLRRTGKPEYGTPQLALTLLIGSIVAHVLAGALIAGTALSEIWLSLDSAGPWLFGVYGAYWDAKKAREPKSA